MSVQPEQMEAEGGIGVSGRFVGRVVEFERNWRGKPKYEWSLAGLAMFVLVGFAYWCRGETFAWRAAWAIWGPKLKVVRVVEDGIRIDNGATTQGMNYLLDAGFRAQAAVTTWYATIINNAAYSAVAVGDTAASHAGWAEWTGYNESVRQTWSPAAAAAGSIANSTAMTFTNNSGSSVTIRGVALFSTNTKGAGTGILWATAIEGSGRTLSNLQAFQVIYQVDLTPTS